MPIEVKQMTIQSSVTSAQSDQPKQEAARPSCQNNGFSHLSPHEGEDYQAIKTMFHKLEQDRRER
ncbi:hypothetical protein VA7868_01494 [Vibrio aerogenes CECT 7868]|uniref:Uncharacterized protein n=1 Tax=Vibrio aerogenes CECT 7868 TaxID=1216006 RepID=A0A1M5Y4N7_9VIBR|nr:hypothetical protein [Vibrio aerogenes]SHI07040.1 hypothetical protein VA7868_01494 [Vibrio aerogenes CECT 7868]